MATAMEVLLTGGDTDLGRNIAVGFRDAGHAVVITGGRRAELDVVAKELDVESIVLDNSDPASLEAARHLLPSHVDALVHVPAPQRTAGDDARDQSLTAQAAGWRSALDATLLSAVLTVQLLGDHLRSGGAIINVVPENPREEGSAEAAVKAALSNWAAGQAVHFGIRGISVNVVAAGRAALATYDGIGGAAPSVTAEFTRLALFLTTPAARHITGQTLHVSNGALTNFA